MFCCKPPDPHEGSGAIGGAKDQAELVKTVEFHIQGRTEPEDEKRVLAILKKCNKIRFNYVIAKMDLNRLLGDHTGSVFGTHRKELLRLFYKTRLVEMTIDSRARVITAMQRRCNRPTGEQEAIMHIFRGTTGKSLTELKIRIDEMGQRSVEEYAARTPLYGLYHLLFDSISDSDVRDLILHHFDREARNKRHSLNIRLVCNMENTLFQAHEEQNMGMASKFSRYTVLPGVLQFLRETAQDLRTVIISDKAYFENFGMVQYVRRMFLTYGLQQPIFISPPRSHIPNPMDIGSTATEAVRRKFHTYYLFRSLFPEHRTLFLGDSSHDGRELGREIMIKFGKTTQGIFLHDLTRNGIEPLLSDRDRARQYTAGAFVFDTYIGAAGEAYEDGLVTAGGMVRVASAAVQEFLKLPPQRFPSQKHYQHREYEIKRDFEAVNKKLARENKIQWNDLYRLVERNGELSAAARAFSPLVQTEDDDDDDGTDDLSVDDQQYNSGSLPRRVSWGSPHHSVRTDGNARFDADLAPPHATPGPAYGQRYSSPGGSGAAGTSSQLVPRRNAWMDRGDYSYSYYSN